MFCPNCGTQNEDSATACQKCGFNLKGAAAPKFKGTMLMVNAPPMVPRPGAPAAGGPVGSPAPKPAGKPLMKATMIGVAPPSPGAVAPPQVPAPVPAPAPVAAPAPFAPVAAPAPFAPVASAATTAMAATPAAAPQFQPPAAVPAPVADQGAVNPLGGTMVASPGGMGYGVPAPVPAPVGQPAGFGAPSPGFAPAPVAPAAMGDPNALSTTTPSGFAPGELPHAQAQQPVQQAHPGWGQPPAASPVGYGAPSGGSAPGGYGAPPAYGAAPAAYGAVSPYGAPGALAPGGQPGYPVPGPTSPHGPIGKTRNPVMVVVLTYVTCGLYGIIALLSMLGELKAFRQKDDINPILFLLPIISLLELIKLPAKVLEAKRMAGVPNAQEPNVILYVLLGIYFIPADLNEVWQAASARQGMGALPPAGM